MPRGKVITATGTQAKPQRKVSRSSSNVTPVQNKKKQAPAAATSVPVCSGCSVLITDGTKALQCERCNSDDAWKCAGCLAISSEFYESLVSDGGCAALHWFCHECKSQVFSSHPAEDSNVLVKLMQEVVEQVKELDRKLDSEADMNEVIELQRKVDSLANVEGKVDKVMDSVVSVHVSMDEMIKAEKELVDEVIRMEKEVIGILRTC